MGFATLNRDKVPRCVIFLIAFLLVPSGTLTSPNSTVRAKSRHPDSSSSSIFTSTDVTLALLESQQRPWLEETLLGKEQETEASRTYPERNMFNNISDAGQNAAMQGENIIESCWLGISCEEFSVLTPPHDVINIVPPPPLPLFLFQMEIVQETPGIEDISLLMNRFDFQNYYVIEKEKQNLEQDFAFRVNPQWLSTDPFSACALCNWAKNLTTEPLFVNRDSFKVTTDGTQRWIKYLICVAFISGFLGAILTCLLIKLQLFNARFPFMGKNKGLTSPKNCNKDMNEVTEDSSINSMKNIEDPEVEDDVIKNKIKSYSHFPVGTNLKNVDLDETYVNANAVSLTYSDFSPRYVDTICTTCYKNIIVNFRGNDCGCKSRGLHLNPTGMSTLSNNSLEPLTEYYSDVSVCRIQSSRRKKKIRKVDFEKNNNKVMNSINENFATVNMLPSCCQQIANCGTMSPSCNQNQVRTQPFQNFSPCINSVPNYFQRQQRCLQLPICNTKNPNIQIDEEGTACPLSNYPAPMSTFVPCPSLNVQPGCVQLDSNCVHYVSNCTMPKNLDHINNCKPTSFIENCESVPKLLNIINKNLGVDVNLNNNMVTNHSESDNTKCTINTECHLQCPLTFYNVPSSGSHVQCQQNISDRLMFDYENYKEYSSSEVPSEYI